MNRSVTFTTRKDGKEWKYLCYKGESFIEYDMLYEKETLEENGVLFEMALKDNMEFLVFCSKAKEKLAYFDTVALLIDGKLWDNKIYRNDLFQWSSNGPYSEMHFCLKDVVYTIDWNKLGMRSINIPVALRFGLTDGLIPNPSREVIIMNKETIALLQDRIKKVCTYFVEKYNESLKSYTTLLEAYPILSQDSKYVELEGTKFHVSNVDAHADIKFEESKLSGVQLKSSLFYYSKRSHMFDEYESVAYETRTSTKRKHIAYELPNLVFYDQTSPYRVAKAEETKIVELSHGTSYSGRLRDYLMGKHGSSNVFYVTKYRNRALKNAYWNSFSAYNSLLELKKVPKDKWRDHIKEWQYVQNSVADSFIKEVDVETSADYLAYLEHRKEQLKANRAKGIYNSKALNRQKGDIVISYPRLSKLDKKSWVFEKATYPIDKLHQNPFVTVYFEETEENKTTAWQLLPLIDKFKVRFALVGKKEINKIPKIHNFVTYMEYTKGSHFKKFCTAEKANKVLKTYDSMMMGRHEIIKAVAEKHSAYVQQLRNYIDKYHIFRVDSGLKHSMMEIAEEHNLWDMEVNHLIDQLGKDIEVFDFVPVLTENNGYVGQEAIKARYNKVFNQLLLFRKKYGNALEEFDLVPKVKEEEITLTIGQVVQGVLEEKLQENLVEELV